MVVKLSKISPVDKLLNIETDHHKILLVKHVVAFKKVDDSIVGEEHTWLAGVVGELLTGGRRGGGEEEIWARSSI